MHTGSKFLRACASLRIHALLGAIVSSAPAANAQQDPFGTPYQELCAVCHGASLEGAAQGTALVGVPLRHGESIADLERSIAAGFPPGMPGWSQTLDATAIQRLAIYVAEQRSALAYTDFKVASPPVVPEGVIGSEKHALRIETIVEGLDRLPFSIAPLADGRILVSEKTRGLRIVSADGELSELVRGTPAVYDDGFEVPGIRLVYGLGYLLDVAPHPEYEKNGWIYLHYTERCSDCNAASRASGRPVSMNVLVRGRIEDGAWVGQETLWRTDVENYTAIPDMGAGGRIAFDDDGHVYFGVGIKGPVDGNEGIQDLGRPYGKIHRINDDGSVPDDNPFVNVPKALPTIWTYGHRSPQGLEFDRKHGKLWSTEMGPRGGDEVNLLRPGRNYGWPLYSRGIEYDGRPVDARQQGLDFALEDIEQPVVDLTPSPAISSFIIYDGAAFPEWRDDMLVGTLKATELYRMVVEGDRIVHTETLLKDLGRIRDIETGPDGLVYLLIEHASGGRILRLVPAK